MYNYVAEKQVAHYRSLIQSALDRLRERLEREYGIGVRTVLVGSGTNGLVTRNGKGGFDLDYNLVLLSIPPQYAGAPEELKSLIRKTLDGLVPSGFSHGKDSTSSIRPIRKEWSSMWMWR